MYIISKKEKKKKKQEKLAKRPPEMSQAVGSYSENKHSLC